MRTLLDLPKVCAALSCGPTRLYALIRAGKFPAPIRDGKCSRWSSTDVDQYVAQLEQTPRDIAARPPAGPRGLKRSA